VSPEITGSKMFDMGAPTPSDHHVNWKGVRGDGDDGYDKSRPVSGWTRNGADPNGYRATSYWGGAVGLSQHINSLIASSRFQYVALYLNTVSPNGE
jgi:hypothetical protein